MSLASFFIYKHFYTLTLLFRVSPSSMVEVGALEAKALLCREGEQGGVKVELKVSTCVLLHQTTAYRSTVSLLRDGQM